MQHQCQARCGIQRLAIDADVVVVDRIIGIQNLAGGIGHPPFAEHQRNLLAAAIAEVGDVLDDLHARAAFTASMILKPSRPATVRTCPKPAPSADS